VRDDTVFNESLAVAVEQEGVKRWLARTRDARQADAFERTQRLRAEFAALVGKYRGRLAALYREPLPPEAMRARKADVLRALNEEYGALRSQGWAGYAGYDDWFGRKPNNAQLASVAIYSQLVPEFKALLQREEGDLPRFFSAVRDLAARPKDERDARLAKLSPPVPRER
jgi:predicted aminopeptidase